MRFGRVLLWVFALALIGVIGYRFLPDGETGELVDIELATQQSKFRAFVSASGEIVANRFAEIGANNMGRIVQLPVEEGQSVRQGDLLARIDPIQAEADLAAAEAQVRSLEAEAAAAEDQIEANRFRLEQAQARSREASLQLQRLQKLFDQGVTSRASLDTAIAESEGGLAEVAEAQSAVTRAKQSLRAAQRRVTQAQAQVQRFQDVLNKTEIRSPIRGTVTRLGVRKGEMVVIGIQNQPGTRLMTISDLTVIDAEVQVAEAEILSVELGQRATVTLEAFPERRFEGRVTKVGASATTDGSDQTSAGREFRVVIQLDEPDPRLKPGLTCDAEIQVAELSDVVTVPLQAVVLREFNGSEQTGVFVAQEGLAEFRPVKASIIGGLDIVVEGFDSSESIIAGPYQVLRDLEDGARIRIAESPSS